MGANYNARLCAGSRKSAGARTMENNGKNNAQNSGTVGHPGALTSGRDLGKDRALQTTLVLRKAPHHPQDVGLLSALPERERPPMSSGGRRSQCSETRISAIADFARKRKPKKKALLLFLRTPRGRRQGKE
jgi:hypothetical protein